MLTNTRYQQCVASYNSPVPLIIYEVKQKPDEQELVSSICEIFHQSRNNYGTRKIKVELEKKENRFLVVVLDEL